ncbi:hypothetical protein AALA99_13725 [Anaerotruncus colihominis]|uniref:hypothetical protein n=1 Tax=Anaerotruncus colihominis TaxID=169435 RepID=UPI00351986A8
MPDSTIGELPQVGSLDDDSLMVVEQQGSAMKMTGRQFKDFGRQSVIDEVQGLVDEAKAAANSITNMTVEAHTAEIPTVEKTMKDNMVNLDFGLPQGPAGPQGKQGERGPRGDPGKGLTVLGYYASETALRDAVNNPSAGDAYGVGEAAPYDIYVFDGVTMDWVNNGPFSGGGGGDLTNVVRSEGGADMQYSEAFPDVPHTILVTDEEEPPLTADDIEITPPKGMTASTVQEAVDQLFTSVSDGKKKVAAAITDKGIETAQNATFQTMADNIAKIQTGTSTGDATATAGDILAGKTAYIATGKAEGLIPTKSARTYTPGTADQTIVAGQYLGGTQTIKGDANLTSVNIKKGVSIFGVTGAMESTFQATLTVTVDVGAVVTATCGSQKVEALSTTGTVVMDLPTEGTWSVTAVRGAAQYNTATVVVTNQYKAALTASLHVKYYSDLTIPGSRRSEFAAATIGDYALFGGGTGGTNSAGSATVDVYNKQLNYSSPETLSVGRSGPAAASISGYALFAGGTHASIDQSAVDAYDFRLTRTTPTPLSQARAALAGAAVSGYALFAGGKSGVLFATVDAYNEELTRSTPTPLIQARPSPASATAGSYALFAGGGEISGAPASNLVDAYNSSLTRSTPLALGVARFSIAGAAAGSYALFVGGRDRNFYDAIDVYDSFLTKTESVERPPQSDGYVGTTLNGFAIFRPRANQAVVYDPYLVRTLVTDTIQNFTPHGAAPAGDYALFAGSDGSVQRGAVYKYI